MKRLIRYFLKGLLIFVPAALTIFAVVWVFSTLDSLLQPLLDSLLKIPIPGLGFVITIVTITVIGFLASNFVGRKIFELIEKVFTKVPLIKLFYSAIKDMIEAFAGEKKKFDKPVIAGISKDSSAKIVGFITRDSLENLGLDDYVAVYMPQSYNFAGNVLLFPKDAVQPLDIDSSDAMAFIVSGGVSGPSRS